MDFPHRELQSSGYGLPTMKQEDVILGSIVVAFVGCVWSLCIWDMKLPLRALPKVLITTHVIAVVICAATIIPAYIFTGTSVSLVDPRFLRLLLSAWLMVASTLGLLFSYISYNRQANKDSGGIDV